jgi:16S rRNA (cytidine1402-2'-O)-methyltransferase
MSLTLISVPIGNLGDITLRALESLKGAELFIGEERKPMFRLLKELGVATPQNYELLNEHSTPEDIKRLVEFCKNQNVVLLTDCGTPGFSDPGAELVFACRQKKISVTANPGASSLTTFLSLSGLKLVQFNYDGFLPRDSEERINKFRELAKIKTPTIIMDTAYRLKKTLSECLEFLPNKKFVLGMSLTKPNELVLSGSIESILKNYDGEKHEFLLLIY